MSKASLGELEAAAALVHGVFGPTPAYRWPLLCERAGCEVWVKHENHTPTGAFKIRGGLVFMSQRIENGETGGVIAASTGNHGQSITVAGRQYGIDVSIVVPRGNSPEKNALMRAQGANLIEHGRDFQESFEFAEQKAGERGLFMMPSFDQVLVAGVGTYALELFRTVPDLDTVYVPIGLGSGICGVISARDALGSKAAVVGVVAEGAPCYKHSFEAGVCVSTNSSNTFAAGVACRVPVQAALETICAGAERVVAVNDDEIRAAIRVYFTDTHNAVEGAGAVALAGLLQERARMKGNKAGLIVSGGNVDMADFHAIIGDVREPVATVASN